MKKTLTESMRDELNKLTEAYSNDPIANSLFESEINPLTIILPNLIDEIAANTLSPTSQYLYEYLAEIASESFDDMYDRKPTPQELNKGIVLFLKEYLQSSYDQEGSRY